MLQNDYNISVAYCTNIFNIGGGHIIAMLFLLLLQLLAEYKSAGRRGDWGFVPNRFRIVENQFSANEEEATPTNSTPAAATSTNVFV